ncbi:MAG: hypothetical protein LZF63_13060 [Nitrosomonas sp.]|nr:hypothetical protein [Nitrosomonas sp.]MCG7757573.1 hypothetical protein [Nitrosomonas sp.]
MSQDYITAQQEEEYKESNRRYLLWEAAIHVINGMDRESAKEHVYEIDFLRSEAEQSDNVMRDEEGYVESYLESKLNPPSTEGMNKSQIATIHKELCESEGVPFKE